MIDYEYVYFFNEILNLLVLNMMYYVLIVFVMLVIVYFVGV